MGAEFSLTDHSTRSLSNQPPALSTLSPAIQIATTIDNKEIKQHALGGIVQPQREG
ncbi:MAG: hypothetical protein RID53_03145 [Coleofasciculus sp. B1-GNL1-01]|uniref:hypothetical protein n=1 Tax=Coleofasciculus sp. B1-GNL1-01 TaxID=3068484 RepID=UPI0032FBD347